MMCVAGTSRLWWASFRGNLWGSLGQALDGGVVPHAPEACFALPVPGRASTLRIITSKPFTMRAVLSSSRVARGAPRKSNSQPIHLMHGPSAILFQERGTPRAHARAIRRHAIGGLWQLEKATARHQHTSPENARNAIASAQAAHSQQLLWTTGRHSTRPEVASKVH